jgi:hypothetical protein
MQHLWNILKPSKAVVSTDGIKHTPKGHVMVVRNMTMPSGKTVRVVRKDALDRALARSKKVAEAG